MVELHKSEKRRSDIIREHKLIASSLNNWTKQYAETKSFKAADNKSKIEKQLIRAEKELKPLLKLAQTVQIQ